MALINLSNGKPIPSLSSEELDRLLRSDVSKSDNDNRSKYQNEWKRNNKDTIRIDVPKGYKEVLKQEASKRGMSLTKLLLVAVEEYLNLGR